jgi:tetratricopeptide (TPR) repeat protein
MWFSKGRVIALGLLSVVEAGCGNQWANTKSRDETPAALKAKGVYFYDKGRYEEASAIFEKLLNQDPENEDARVFYAYTLNSLAGLSVLDLIGKLSGVGKTTSAKLAPLAPTPTPTASSTSNLLRYISVLGLNDNDRTSLTTKLDADAKVTDKSNPDYAKLVEHSPKIALFKKSWEVACRLIPATTLDEMWGKALSSEALKTAVSAEACKGGLPAGNETKSAALFALSMTALAQAATLYQLIVDANGDGTVDLVASASTLSTNITSVNSQAATSTNPSAALETLNGYIKEMQNVAAKIQSTSMDVTLFQFNLLSNLAVLLGASNQIKETINKAITAFDSARDKIKEYTSAAGSNNKFKDSVNKAADTVNKLYEAAKTPEEKAKLDAQKSTVCGNFDSLKTTYNLPADTQKPSSCS